MKKITSALLLLLPFLGMAQAEQKIQVYLDANRQKSGLTVQDVSDWIVESKLNSESTKIDNYFVKQRYNGTEIFNSVSNFWVKNGVVINGEPAFVANVSQKVNAVTPQLSVLQALSSGIAELKLTPNNFSIIETKSPKEFKISNGNLDPISAELVYQETAPGVLRLSWDFTIDVAGHNHLFSIRVDATTGKIIAQNDMVVSCSFDAPLHKATIGNASSTEFTKNFFKSPQSVLETQSGSYRVVPVGTESPAHGPRQLVSNPHNVLASPFG
ncbi:MAG: peptidase M36, partial [Proteobacteria bacterium]